ncbi:hypothetical protein E3N88_10520 [Mikania micrantha]|uniref:Uncharacterized protein n=1 Tax=Mikania micrantha TaxID=192012 RepID=A0A5N6PBZ0_9ASTR|nr:hypothetical protein E3N88_10520 [Mikania micrantha]
MANNNEDAGRNPGRRPVNYELTEEGRQRVRDIVAQVDAETDSQARQARHDRFLGWYPMTIRDWIEGERVPPPRYPGDATSDHPLPHLGVSMERAFEAHVAYTRREERKNHELSDEEHAGRIAATEVANEENQAMIQASDAKVNAWVEQFIVEPPPEEGPQFEAEDLEEGDFDEDPDEDPEEDGDDGLAESGDSHSTIDSD